MNTVNNRRRKQSQEKIEKSFIELLQTKEIEEITVCKLCKITGLNRSTFYANYADIYELSDRIREKLENEVFSLYENDIANSYNSNDYLRLFNHMYENQLFYKTYFKLGFDGSKRLHIYDIKGAEKFFGGKYIEYHIEFFKAGFNAMVKKWLNGGCIETPKEMSDILKAEYQGRI